MATVQDRLRQSRAPVDKWTIREQLCLASAVSCSGDQNWMSVSRTMKLVCGTGANGIPRPGDWYSQKSCAVQYSHLLENVETPKRKKRTSESSGGTAASGGSESSIVAETPTDLVLRKLTDERIQELKEKIRKNQEEYAQLYKDIKEVQTGIVPEERLLVIWHEMEKEEEAERIDEMKWENQMREREQYKQEMQRNWRNITPNSAAVNVSKTTDSATTVATNNSATCDRNIEKNQRPPLLNIQSDVNASPQQEQQPSPLLSSLLKSPTSSTPQTIVTSVVTSSARTSAPTITNLLTGGPIPNAKQPVVIVKNTEVGQLLTRPISGPPNTESALATGVAQNLLSPSQSAPTLSLLLEKAKSTNTTEQISSTNALDTKIKNDEQITEKASKSSEKSTAVDSNNDEVPMEIEEDLATYLVEPDETDPNEEQQLLEVFENIGNIEMEIDAEFLTAMDEETHTDAPDFGNFKAKVEITTNSSTGTTTTITSSINTNASSATNTKEHLSTAVPETIDTPTTTEISVHDSNGDTIEIKENNEVVDKCKDEQILEEKIEIKDDETIIEIAAKVNEKVEAEEETELVQRETLEKELKVETISSDDSNDNIPLATVASTLDIKDRHNADVDNYKTDERTNEEEINEPIKIETADDNNDDISNENNENENVDSNNKKALGSENQNKSTTTNSTAAKEDKELEKQNTEIKEKTEVKQDEIKNDLEEIKIEQKEESGEKDVVKEEVHVVTTTTVTVDIYDESCTSDAEKSINDADNTKAIKAIPLSKNEPKTDIKTTVRTSNEDNEKTQAPATAVTLSIPLTSALVRPPAIRKLRERDRSESPLVTDDDEQHTVSTTAASRLRRRGSSTPIMDSVPSSPASVSDRDDRELRNASKKSLMQIFIALQQKHGMNIALLEQSFTETEKNKNGAKYGEVCLRPMDFQAIQQNIESNNMRSKLELQRDILLMCQNALMLYAVDTPQHIAAMQIKQDCRNLNELCSSIYENKSSCEKDSKDQNVNKEFKSNIITPSTGNNNNNSNNASNTSSSVSLNTSSSAKSRSGFRKSQRIT